jgi:hypothetical protein
MLTPVPTLCAAVALLALSPAAGRVATAQGEFLKCPIAQPAARNGTKPDPELLKKLVRCKKGEKQDAVEGSVGVEVTALQVGAPRAWSYNRDIGNGDKNTVVYPVKVTYTTRTYWKTRTEISENWIRIMNFYVNAFGEWQSGSEEPIRAPDNRSVAPPKGR